MTFDTQKQLHTQESKFLLLKTVPLFSELSDTDIQWFLQRASFAEYFKNNFLFQHGDPAESLYIIMEGWVKLYRDDAEGEQIVQGVLTRCDTFGEECVVKGRTYPYHAQVVGRNAKFLILSGAILRECVENQPAVALKIISSLADHLNHTGYLLEIHTKLTAAQRLAAFLLKLSMDRGGIKTVFLPYNKFLVAARLGMQPETLSRAMARLKKELDIQFKGREVHIPDLEFLQNYCEIYCFRDQKCSAREQLLCTAADCDIFRMLRMM